MLFFLYVFITVICKYSFRNVTYHVTVKFSHFFSLFFTQNFHETQSFHEHSSKVNWYRSKSLLFCQILEPVFS